MAKSTVEVLVDDLDGSEAAETVRIGWNGQWRELELSEKNLAALSKSFDRYWDVGRPVRAASTDGGRRRAPTGVKSRSAAVPRDPKAIRVWADEQGIAVPSRGRIPRDVEARYNSAVAAA
jgi:hypothetical protein